MGPCGNRRTAGGIQGTNHQGTPGRADDHVGQGVPGTEEDGDFTGKISETSLAAIIAITSKAPTRGLVSTNHHTAPSRRTPSGPRMTAQGKAQGGPKTVNHHQNAAETNQAHAGNPQEDKAHVGHTPVTDQLVQILLP